MFKASQKKRDKITLQKVNLSSSKSKVFYVFVVSNPFVSGMESIMEFNFNAIFFFFFEIKKRSKHFHILF